jgi:4-hydroxy-tetrahydrodipicolinate reductase
MRRDPYRVVVWGPGGIGRACLRELAKRSDCRIVGVLAYSPEKAGKDVGELIGQAPIGVKVTTDKEAIFALDADAVLWAGTLPFDAEGMERDVVRLLESGKHVISSAAFHYPDSHGKAYVEKLEAACRKGKSCLHGTGENPGFWFERIGMSLTGVCNHVERLEMHEYVDVANGGPSPHIIAGAGFGNTEENLLRPGPLATVWQNYYWVEYLQMCSRALFDRPLDRAEHTPTYYVAERNVVVAKSEGDLFDLTIPKGRVYAMTHSFTGYLDGQPRLITSVNWYLRPKNSPFRVKSSDYWLFELEGTPVSLRCEVSAFASLRDELAHHPGDQTCATWNAAAVTMIQAIPVVCSHEPGIVYPSVFATASPDLRRMEGRKSLAG